MKRLIGIKSKHAKIAGVMVIIGETLSASDDPWMQAIGAALSACAGIFIMFLRDNKTTSEEAGAK